MLRTSDPVAAVRQTNFKERQTYGCVGENILNETVLVKSSGSRSSPSNPTHPPWQSYLDIYSIRHPVKEVMDEPAPSGNQDRRRMAPILSILALMFPLTEDFSITPKIKINAAYNIPDMTVFKDVSQPDERHQCPISAVEHRGMGTPWGVTYDQMIGHCEDDFIGGCGTVYGRIVIGMEAQFYKYENGGSVTILKGFI